MPSPFGEHAILRNWGMAIRDGNVLITKARAAELAQPVGASAVHEELDVDYVSNSAEKSVDFADIAGQDDALRVAAA